MSSQGPTTTGSIDAKLTVDDSDFKRGMAEAKAEAKEVGALAPEVKVDANVGPALAKLDAVAMAEHRLEAAQRAKLNTSGALSVAEMRYEAVTTKSGRTDLQVAAAEEALARARRADMVATEKSTVATAALNVAKAESVRKSAEEAAANDAEAESTKRATQANNQRVSAIGVLIALAPAVLSAAAPIAAAAVGLGAAFGVMGVSGVLAIKGIKDAMQVGDTVGNTYASGLTVVKGNLDQLAGTAATGMLSAFSSAIDGINGRMPFLSRMTGEFSVQLGQIGGTALRGVLDGLQQMMPLLQAGGNELSKFVTWLFSFNGTNGFNQFISYAVENLPSVMHLIENLVTTAGHILSAFAPMGPVVIGALSGISDILNALPLPVLAGLVTTATAVAPAMNIAGSAIAMFGIKTQLSIPVVGLITAALSGLGMMAATAALGTDQGTAAMTSYGDAVQRDNGLIGENVRLQAAHAATTKEMRDAADSLGLSTITVLNAMLGEPAAISTTNNAMATAIDRREQLRRGDENLTDTSLRLKHAKDTLTNGIQQNTTEINNNIDAYHAYKGATDAGTGATNMQTTALQAQAAQYGVTVSQYQAATDAQTKTGTTTADTTLKMRLQSDAAGLLKMAWDELNGKTISAAQAQNAFDSSLANMGDHISATGKKITFTTTSITDMSAASVALRGELIGQVTGMEKVIEADGGLQNATAQSKQKYAEMREQIIANAVAHGVNRDAAEAYISSIYKVPPAVTTRIEIDTAAANAKLATTKGMLEALRDKTIYVDVQRSDSNVDNTGGAGHVQPVKYNAAGGMVSYLASGGFPGGPKGTDTVPTWLTPGEIVINRASVQSLGAGNLLHANKTGQWPGQGAPQPVAPVVHVYVGNEQLDSRMYTVAQGAIGSAGRDAGRRPAR